MENESRKNDLAKIDGKQGRGVVDRGNHKRANYRVHFIVCSREKTVPGYIPRPRASRG
jgi:hypothetical protein